MGKRSDFVRNKHDVYDTPEPAVDALLPHLGYIRQYAEPCAGNGQLIKYISEKSNYKCSCYWASDIEPRPSEHSYIVRMDALELEYSHIEKVDAIITNPPWTREIFHPMILHFMSLKPTWLLTDADWAFTKQSAPYMKFCTDVVPIGRLKWIPDSKYTSKDSCAWYRFDKYARETIFHQRKV